MRTFSEQTHNFRPVNTDAKASGAEEALLNNLNAYGYATFNNMTGPRQLLHLASQFGHVNTHEMTSDQGITTLTTTPQAKDERGTYTPDYELFPHIDGAAVETPASLIMMYCVQPDTAGGGTSIMVDGKQLYASLAYENPALLDQLKDPNAATFGHPEGDQYTGAIFSEKNGVHQVRFRLDDRAHFRGSLAANLPRLTEAIEAQQSTFALGRYEGYVVDNRRMLHGRTAIKGARTIKRVHVEPTADSVVGGRVRSGFYL